MEPPARAAERPETPAATVEVRPGPGPGVATVVATGEIDVATSPRLRAVLIEACNDHDVSTVVVDLTKVTFMDSSGLGVLVGGLKRLRERDGSLMLRGPNPTLSRVLEITGLDQLLPVVEE